MRTKPWTTSMYSYGYRVRAIELYLKLAKQISHRPVRGRITDVPTCLTVKRRKIQNLWDFLLETPLSFSDFNLGEDISLTVPHPWLLLVAEYQMSQTNGLPPVIPPAVERRKQWTWWRRVFSKPAAADKERMLSWLDMRSLLASIDAGMILAYGSTRRTGIWYGSIVPIDALERYCDTEFLVLLQ